MEDFFLWHIASVVVEHGLHCLLAFWHLRSFQAHSAVETTCNAGDQGDVGSIPGSKRSPAGGHGNPLQYSCLENPMDREAWQATVHRVIELDTAEVTEYTQQT